MNDDGHEHRGWYGRGYLPHFDTGGPTFITFRLKDSLPRSVLDDLASDSASDRRTAVEGHLDTGLGDCVLERPEVADIVVGALQYFDGDRYRLDEWVVMPNHVHVLIERLKRALGSILHSWKSYTSHKIQEVLPEALTPEDGRLWQREFFDRGIRDKYHFWCVQRYIWLNPVRAGLCETPWDWPWSSAADDDESHLREELQRWFRTWEPRFDDLPFTTGDGC